MYFTVFLNKDDDDDEADVSRWGTAGFGCPNIQKMGVLVGNFEK